jgi:predicted DNA-binding mobile mystery protein A
MDEVAKNAMKQKFKELERKMIKRKLDWLYAHQAYLLHPKEGWIKALRKVLGMTALQLSKKLNVTVSRIYELEKAELDDTTTLKAMKNAAEAMGCRFEYCFVPIKPLDTLLRERAHQVATSKVEYVSHQMALEKQELSEKEKKAQIKQLVEEWLKNPKKLWG